MVVSYIPTHFDPLLFWGGFLVVTGFPDPPLVFVPRNWLWWLLPWGKKELSLTEKKRDTEAVASMLLIISVFSPTGQSECLLAWVWHHIPSEGVCGLGYSWIQKWA